MNLEMKVEHTELRHHKEFQSKISMTVVLITGSMLFGTLFLTYAIFRASSEVWPPIPIDDIPLTLPIINTILLLLSSIIIYLLNLSVKKSQIKQSIYLNYLALLIGVSFLIGQFLLWKQLSSIGIYTSSGIFPSLIYTFTWIHAAHIVIGLILLIFQIPYLSKILTSTDFFEEKYPFYYVANTAIFWHFLDIIWICIFFSLFVF